MKTGKIITVLLLTVYPFIITGQEPAVTDSLQTLTRKADSSRAALMLENGKMQINTGNTESAIVTINAALDLIAGLNLNKPEAEGYKLLGDIYSGRSQWQELLTSYLKALSAYNRGRLKEEEAAVMKIIGEEYFKAGLYAKASFWFGEAYNTIPAKNSLQAAEYAEATARSWFHESSDSLALKWYREAGIIFDNLRNNEGLMRCLRKEAFLNSETGNYDRAEAIYLRLLDYYTQTGDARQRSQILNNTGFVRFRQKDFQSALERFREAETLSLSTGNDPYFLTDLYSNMAVTWQTLGNQREMLRSFNLAIENARASGRKDEEARIAHILALIYFNRQDNYHADLYCRQCVESAAASASMRTMQECYKTWSDVMEKSNDFIKALEYYEKYLGIRDSLNFEERIGEQKEAARQKEYDRLEQQIRLAIAGEEISSLEMKTLKAEAARRENELKLLVKQQELDRSEKERLAQSLVLERERFELSKREQEVVSLLQQQRIDSLELDRKKNEALVLEQANRLLEAEKRQQEINLEREKQVRRYTTGIGILITLVAVMILAGLISTRKKNQRLAESKRQIEKINSDLESKNAEILRQKEIIEQKNQAITDSIQYASRIQTAVLPPVDFLSEWWPDSFILFRPRDIVSGDFYWGRQKGSRVIAAIADCTGHGVPGAFMSMLGNAFLDEIYNTTEITDAAAILNMLRDEVINALKQKGLTGEARDGMDISLCIIDLESLKLDYAGANNPLYIVRDGQLIKKPADKMPIGIHVTDFTPFNNHTDYLKKGDMLYLFTDGYADQFGGPKGKKFMYRPLQNLLLKIHDRPAAEQKEELIRTFEEWMNGYEQVDDVLIAGIRI
ncbi:MAG: SpoIIE family protein phosphatase [Bacteroidales bacterium]|nr:SpoIIE family protein phosphatase [Bacteroidales bacterium]